MCTNLCSIISNLKIIKKKTVNCSWLFAEDEHVQSVLNFICQCMFYFHESGCGVGGASEEQCWRKVGICGVVDVWESIRMEVNRNSLLFWCVGKTMFRYIVK